MEALGRSVETKSRLVSVLSASGKETLLYDWGAGGSALILPHGGRVIGLFTPESEENFFWTHPALGSEESATELYTSDSWHNSGGDRTWLAPELDMFFPKYPNIEHYLQPRSIDPGNYRARAAKDCVTLVNTARLQLFRQKREIEVEITKCCSPTPNPLRHEKSLALPDVQYAGYTQDTVLRLTDGTGTVGLWSLLQLPHGGDLVVPTYFRTDPTVVFGHIPDDCLDLSDHCIRYRMNHLGDAKISIRAVAATGRVGYIHNAGSHWALIVRNFAMNPSGEYVDSPWESPDDVGYSVQACNLNGIYGQFSEMECHTPAIGGKTGSRECRDTSQVWAFRGPEHVIKRIAGILLGPTLPPL